MGSAACAERARIDDFIVYLRGDSIDMMQVRNAPCFRSVKAVDMIKVGLTSDRLLKRLCDHLVEWASLTSNAGNESNIELTRLNEPEKRFITEMVMALKKVELGSVAWLVDMLLQDERLRKSVKLSPERIAQFMVDAQLERRVLRGSLKKYLEGDKSEHLTMADSQATLHRRVDQVMIEMAKIIESQE